MLNALRIPADGEPEVLQHEDWGLGAITHALGSLVVKTRRLDWSPSEHRFLCLHGLDDAEPIPASLTLLGQRGHDWGAPLLVTAHTRTGKTASLSKYDLLVIGTRLLVGEVATRAITAPTQGDPRGT
jgi:hypothetical protein